MKQIQLHPKNYTFILTILQIVIISFLLPLNAQVTIGSGNPPDKGALLDLKENKDGTAKKGLLLPRVSLKHTQNTSPFTEHTAGMYIYNISTEGDVFPGNYFNDGTQWLRIGDTNSGPWYDSSTKQGTISNFDNIYQMGQIGIGIDEINENAQMDIASVTKGILIPRMSTQQRNSISGTLANGLLIYNTSTNCFNYYDTKGLKWMSLCGNLDPASFDLINCDLPTGVKGTYTQGTSLTPDNSYTVVINASESGTYSIVAKTANGYSFSKSGTFTETGRYEILLEGHGAPANGPQTDKIALFFNGIAITPSCVLPDVTVKGSFTAFEIDISGIIINGEYIDGIITDNTNYVDIPVTRILTEGPALIETITVNGIKFSSGAIMINEQTKSIRLYASGTPEGNGNHTYSVKIPGSGTSTFDINVNISMGTWQTPAVSCKQIYDKYPTLEDGMYYVQGIGGIATKTWCDMKNGGWTLVWSRSEGDDNRRSSRGLVVNGTNRLNYNSPRGLSTATATSAAEDIKTVVDPFNFRLPLSSMTAIQNFYKETKEWKIRIVQDQENAFNNNDTWANDNY